MWERVEFCEFHVFLLQKWHPDRISASGNPRFVDEANKKFQAIQQAYSGKFHFS